jgi:hypothetical protein
VEDGRAVCCQSRGVTDEAWTIARTAARIGSGSVGQAFTTSARSGGRFGIVRCPCAVRVGRPCCNPLLAKVFPISFRVLKILRGGTPVWVRFPPPVLRQHAAGSVRPRQNKGFGALVS